MKKKTANNTKPAPGPKTVASRERKAEAGTGNGYLALVLHGHLPFVRHPEHDRFLEEDWLYEAITETYVPLLEVFDRLVNDGVDFRLTMSLTPTLLAMLVDPLLQQRYIRHINQLIELSGKELLRTQNDPALHPLAKMYQKMFQNARTVFEKKYDCNLVAAFRKFQDLGKLELITCAATHGYLPLMENEKAVRVQIMVASADYKKHFGRAPKGIWLPECGYYPGLDNVLKEAGIRYFFIDSHGLMFSSPRAKYGVFAPVYCPSGVAAFARDVESAKQVWSSVEGYPGDYQYRDFYRDIGFDLDFEYLKPYIHPDGLRVNLGIKYYRITGDTKHKDPYNRRQALGRAAEHAADFLAKREEQVRWLSGIFQDRKPLITAPYDAELFGHWWFEGPDWLEFVIRKTALGPGTLRMVTPTEYLRDNPDCQVATPAASSWGQFGYSEVWLDGSNDWIYPHLHKAADRMGLLAQAFPRARGLMRRALKQAARELLLAQSSDWAFIMKSGSHDEYAEWRTKEHIRRFTRLYEDIRADRVDEAWLADIESKDNLFPEIDYRMYA